MRIKNTSNHKQEVIYVSIAGVLATCLIAYLIFLVHSITLKAQLVFGTDVLTKHAEQTFNFEKYDALMKEIYPGNSTVLSTYAPASAVKVTPSLAPAATSTTTTPATTSKP